MSTARSPTLKRILREASDLASQPSPDYSAAPLDSDLFEWHFTILGPPSPSAFASGIYHGRIVLPPAYPLKPPSFRFLTPSGRFEVNREICLSISGHHEESWQPAWGIRTALVAIRSFMDTDSRGQLGGMDASVDVRRRLAEGSRKWKCGVCGRSNEETMLEEGRKAREVGGEGEKEVEVVPEELKLAYREDLEGGKGQVSEGKEEVTRESKAIPEPARSAQPISIGTSRSGSTPTQAEQAPPRQALRDEPVSPWIDRAIYGIIALLFIVLWRKLGG